MVCISSFSYCFEQVSFVRTLSGCRLEPGSVNWVKSRLPKRKQSEELNIGEIETISGLNSCCYKGVRQRSWGRWVSEIREPKKKSRIWLGSFPTPEMAARAYDAAALSIKGEMASLNFPELAASLPRPISTSCKDIQAAAAVAAAALCPPSQLTVADENKKRRNDGKEKTCEVTDKNLLSPTATMDKNFLAEIVGSAEHKEPADLVDEDVIFNLPNLLMHMAEGMLLPPPLPPPSPPCEEDDVGFKGISFLWNF